MWIRGHSPATRSVDLRSHGRLGPDGARQRRSFGRATAVGVSLLAVPMIVMIGATSAGATVAVFTSASSTTFVPAAPNTFTITTAGAAHPSITEQGPLPANVTFVDNGDGTATLSDAGGVPTGIFRLWLTSVSGPFSNHQLFTVKVGVTGDIYTIAGNGSAAISGPGVASASAIAQPTQVATDAAGDLYFTNWSNEVDEVPAASGIQWGQPMSAGSVYTVVGSPSGASGTPPFSSGGMTSALLSGVNGIALDGSGNLYVADSNNNRVLELAATSHLQWGRPMAKNDLYLVAGGSTGVSGCSANGTPAGAAALNAPFGITFDASGNLYVADQGNDRIVEVPAKSGAEWGVAMATAGALYTVAGSPTCAEGWATNGAPAVGPRFYLPTGVAVDASGNLYVADTGDDHVVEVAATNHSQWGLSMVAGALYTVAGNDTFDDPGSMGDGHAATTALLSSPGQLTFDANGDLFIADGGNSRVQEVVAQSTFANGQWLVGNDIYTVAGDPDGAAGAAGDGGPATAAALNLSPYSTGLAIDDAGDLFIADGRNYALREVVGTLSCTSGCGFATVTPTAPKITWPNPASITYGTPLGLNQLDAVASTGGVFTYAPAAGSILQAGSHALTATFSPYDTADYTPASATVTLVVKKATPTLTWSNPAPIARGIPLGATQLNAKSSVTGSFSYSPGAGVVLSSGSHTLSVTFSPSDAVDYNGVSTTVPITVTVRRGFPHRL